MTRKTKGMTDREHEKAPKRFLTRIFMEPDNTPSFARIFTAIIILTLLTWDTFLVWTRGTVPNLSDQALFGGFLYASNKAAATVTSALGKK